MKHIKIPFISHFSKKAGQGKARHSLEEKLPEKTIPLCEHNSYCQHRINNLGYNCFKNQEAKECGQVKRFYDRYGESGNKLGVGL